MRGSERDVESAAELQIAINVVRAKMLRDLAEVALAEMCKPLRFFFAEVGNRKRVRMIDGFTQDSGISSAGAMTGKILFQHDNIGAGSGLFESECRPQAGEA